MNRNQDTAISDGARIEEGNSSTSGAPPPIAGGSQEQKPPTTYIPQEVPLQVPPNGHATDTSPGTVTPSPHWNGQPQTLYRQPTASAYTPVCPVTMEAPPRPRSVPLAGPVLLILAGVLFLLNTTGYVDWSIWAALWWLWPLLLIAIGVDLLLGRRNRILSLLIVLVLLAAGVGVAAVSGNLQPAGNVTGTSVSVPLNGATSARVSIDLGIGELRVDSSLNSADSNLLASGNLDYYQNWKAPSVQQSIDGGVASLNLQQGRVVPTFSIPLLDPNRDLAWQLHLSRRVPIDLNVKTGTGRADLDLSQAKLQNLKVENGTSTVSVIFPTISGTATVDIDNGTGSIDLAIPSSVEARIRASAGIGSVNVDSRFSKDGNTYTTSGYQSGKNRLDITLNTGIGSINVSDR